MYTAMEAKDLGRRDVCKERGKHDIEYKNWVSRPEDGKPVFPPDNMKCAMCDAVFTVTYPELGTVAQA